MAGFFRSGFPFFGGGGEDFGIPSFFLVPPIIFSINNQ